MGTDRMIREIEAGITHGIVASLLDLGVCAVVVLLESAVWRNNLIFVDNACCTLEVFLWASFGHVIFYTMYVPSALSTQY